jgi:GNAT superfamily N-acetyltransferase
MGRELDGPIAVPEVGASMASRRDWDLEAAGRLMDLGSGDQPGEWFRALGALDPRDAYLYMVTRNGVPVSFLLGHDHEEDSPHWFAATAASERRRGLGRQAILSALRDAQRRGCTSSTSHATASGARLAESCGYRRLAPVTAWVRRFDSPAADGAPRAARAPAPAGGR